MLQRPNRNLHPFYPGDTGPFEPATRERLDKELAEFVRDGAAADPESTPPVKDGGHPIGSFIPSLEKQQRLHTIADTAIFERLPALTHVERLSVPAAPTIPTETPHE